MKIVILSIFLFTAMLFGCKPENTPQQVKSTYVKHAIDTNLLTRLQEQNDTAQYLILKKLTPNELDTFFKTYKPAGKGCVFYKNDKGEIVGTKIQKLKK